jgi:hypothetical protein
MQKKLDSGTCQKHSKTIMNIAKITKQKNEVLISATKLKGGQHLFRYIFRDAGKGGCCPLPNIVK